MTDPHYGEAGMCDTPSCTFRADWQAEISGPRYCWKHAPEAPASPDPEETRMTDITTIPAGTAVTLTLKGDAALVQGTIVGPYTRDVMPAVLIHTGRDRDYPEVAVPLHTIADVHVH